ncbi:MAG: site-specific integrase [Planctomycetes bacterium]|nr:site-specific integrase [Planctomycetota bacterium]
MASLIRRPDSPVYYIQFCVGQAVRRVSTGTDSLQIAKEKLRQFESGQARGEHNPLPTRTTISSVVAAYVTHIRTVKTAKSAQTDIYYLRDAFGPICEPLQITSRKVGPRSKKRPPKPGQDRRRRAVVIEAASFEQITTSDIAAFIGGQVRNRGLAPKTANRYREILVRLFNWAMTQHGIRLPSDKNPAVAVERYREQAPTIRFLTLAQIAEQLNVFHDSPKMHALVATYIYAGLRREEALWLTPDDFDFNTGAHGMIRVRAKTVAGESWEPKTNVNRAVPISTALRVILDGYIAKAKSKGAWFFPSPEGKRWDADNFSADLRDANTKAKLAWTNLDFRHTFGSQLAMKGESLFKIAKLLGNSPEICRRHYAALVPEEMSASVEFPEPVVRVRLTSSAGAAGQPAVPSAPAA